MNAVPRPELIRKLRRLGFDGPFSGGKHQFMRKNGLKLRIPNPHKNNISVDLLNRILKQAGISEEEFEHA